MGFSHFLILLHPQKKETMKLICVTPINHNKLIYIKPDTCLIRNNEAFYMPEFSQHITARPALVIKIKKIGKNINERFASRYYEEISAGLNLEANDVLSELKSKGLPWDRAVAFDRSAPLGIFHKKSEETEIELTIDKKIVHILNINHLLIHQIISEASHLFTLKIGDLIYISPCEDKFQIKIGQEFALKINNDTTLQCNIK